MSQADLVELVADLQNQLSKRGAAGFRTLELAFIVNDRDQNGLFDFAELEAILGKAGLFVKRQNLTKLYRYFDHDQNERVRYEEVLDAIRGPLSPRRANIINQVFDKLDTNQHGAVDIERVVKSFDPTRHPQVLSGEKRPEALSREFANAFDGAGMMNNGAVTRSEFVRFYHGIAAGIPYDDDFFVNILERCWGVKESIPTSLVHGLLGNTKAAEALAPSSRTPLLARVRNIFREKVRQKTLNTKSEVENLRLVFKHFDLSNTGIIDFNTFKRALERYGIVLDERTLLALFAEFDDGNGRMEYLAFATALYEEDVTSATHHQFNRSQQLKQTQQLASTTARPESRREYLDSDRVLISSPVAPATSASQDQAAPGVKRAGVRRTLNQKERENSVLPTVVFLFGGPAVGRTTQASRIVREFGFVLLNLTTLLRAESQSKNSQVRDQVNDALSAGRRVPAEISVNLLSKAIQENVNKGSLYFLITDFPNTLAERQAWEKVQGAKVDVPFAIYFETSQTIMEQRLESRAKQEGRPIDVNEVKRQFNEFARDTISVVNSFGEEGRLQVVNASGTPDAVYQQVQEIIATL